MLFGEIFFAVLAALFAYNILGDWIRARSERHQASKTPCVAVTYKLANGEILEGWEMNDYDTDDVFLWDYKRKYEWRFTRYNGQNERRTWRPTDGNFASFLRNVKRIELIREESSKTTPVNDTLHKN